jgi:AhpD family alkylhydroperoxidase
MNKLFCLTKSITTVLITVLILSASMLAQEGESNKWQKAQQEMKEMFGTVPVMFTKLPEYVRASAWEWFKSMANPNSAIPAKYSELISLAVAAQIPCDYCIYAHIEMARMHGATEEEINEAVMKAAEVRHWSTILNGNEVDLNSFKSEWDDILNFVKTQSASK